MSATVIPLPIPITSHPSQAVVTRARLIVAGGGVAIERRCEQGLRAKVRGNDEPVYTVTIGPLGARCTCVALRLCAHIGAAAHVGADVAQAPCTPGADGCCEVCARILDPVKQREALDGIIERMRRS